MRRPIALCLSVLIGCSSKVEKRDRDADAQVIVDEDAGVEDVAETIDADTAPDTGEPDAAVEDTGNECVSGPRKPAPPPRLHVVNGTRQPTLVPLTPEQVMAVVGLASTRGEAWCSGTLISDDVVLTAQHCTVGEAASDMRVLFGE